MDKNRIRIKKFMRYIDDGRAFLSPLKHGWRWEKGELLLMKKWKDDLRIFSLKIAEWVLVEGRLGNCECLNY